MTTDELKSIRNEMNLRPKSLAQALGIDQVRYERMEAGLDDLTTQETWAVRYLLEHPEERPEVEFEDIRPYSPAELIDEYLESYKLQDGRSWGDWRFDAECLSLDYQSEMVTVEHDENGQPLEARRERYSIPLTDMINAKRVLDWIGQIAGKGWGPPAVGNLVEALDEIFNLQATFVHQDEVGTSDNLAERLKSRIVQQEEA